MNRIGLGVVPVCLLATLVACSEYPRMAVRLTASGAVEIVEFGCYHAGVVRAEVIEPDEGSVLDERDPRLWRIDFEAESRALAFVVGETPPGSREVVAWRAPRGDATLVAALRIGSSFYLDESFKIDDLAGGKVRYRSETMTAEEFEKARKCR